MVNPEIRFSGKRWSTLNFDHISRLATRFSCPSTAAPRSSWRTRSTRCWGRRTSSPSWPRSDGLWPLPWETETPHTCLWSPPPPTSWNVKATLPTWNHAPMPPPCSFSLSLRFGRHCILNPGMGDEGGEGTTDRSSRHSVSQSVAHEPIVLLYFGT